MATDMSSNTGTPVGPGRESGAGSMGSSEAGAGETAGRMAGLPESVKSFMSTADEALHARRVYGDPIERGGVTVIPVARVMGGVGMGTGPMAGRAGEGKASSGQSGGQTGTGGGFGVRAQPAGVFEIRGESVRWVPSVDVNQIVLGGQIVMIVLLLTIRAIANMRAKTAEREAAERRAPVSALAAPAAALAATVEGLRHRVAR